MILKNLTKNIKNLYITLKFLKYNNIYRKFKKFTMIPIEIYYNNLELCEKFSKIQGAIVECGTWKGGMIGGIAYKLGNERAYVLFDSFEGLPPAQEIDGDSALNWQANKNSSNYFDNCTASEQSAIKAMNISGAKNVSIVKGWFNETLPNYEFKDGIAILRMDGDWYDSTFEILDNLFPLVNHGGIIIIDDYYAWDGCARAVHDYLSANMRTERIRTSKGGICYIIKNVNSSSRAIIK